MRHQSDPADPAVRRSPAAPAPDEPSPAVTDETQRRLAAADLRARRNRDPHYVRHGVAFGLAMVAVGGLARSYRPWEDD